MAGGAKVIEGIDRMSGTAKWSVGETGGEGEKKRALLRERAHLTNIMETAESMLERFEGQFTFPEYEALEDLMDYAQKRLDVVEAKSLGERFCGGCGEVVEGEYWSMAYGLAEAGRGHDEVLLLCSRCMPEVKEGNLGKEGHE